MKIKLPTKMCIGIGVSCIFFLSHPVANAAEINSYSPIENKQDIVTESSLKKNIIPPSYFKELLKRAADVQPVTLKFIVLQEKDFAEILVEINSKMPDKVEITSPTFTQKQLYEMYGKAEREGDIDTIPNFKNLFTYSKEKNYGKKLILVDDIMDNVGVRKAYAAYETYVDILSKGLKGKTESESLLNIYEYVYNNFEYTASDRRKMYLPNIGNGALACNGLSRLMNDLLNHAGVHSEIRQGESHFWNIVKINGQSITVDITTDILKKKPYLTLGSSTKEHLEMAITSGLYSAEFNLNKYKAIKKSTFKKVNNLPIY